MQGAFFLPCSNRSRTRRRRRRRTSRRSPSRRSRRTARSLRRRWRGPAASCRFPEGPSAARPSECGRRASGTSAAPCRNSMISWSSSLASSTPATSLNVTFFCVLEDSLARLLPNDSALLPPLCICRMMKIQKPIIRRIGAQAYSSVAHGLVVGSLAVISTLRSTSLLPRPSYCGGAYRPVFLARLRGAEHFVAGENDFLDLPFVEELDELAEGNRLVAGLEGRRKVPDEHPDDDEHHPEEQALERRVQPEPPDRLNFKISTLVVRGVTRKSADSATPTAHTMRSSASTTTGTESRISLGILRSTKRSCSFFLPAIPSGRMMSPARHARTLSAPVTRAASTTAMVPA